MKTLFAVIAAALIAGSPYIADVTGRGAQETISSIVLVLLVIGYQWLAWQQFKDGVIQGYLHAKGLGGESPVVTNIINDLAVPNELLR